MPLVKCLICGNEFFIKPSHQKLGWGKYCSRGCKWKAQNKGKFIKCFICYKKVYRSPKELGRSKSGKFFCSKRCQTLWRNQTYVGDKSSQWIDGIRAYRDILKRSGKELVCALCKIKDSRVLIVHHKDHNRRNNNVLNLVWLCFNCHFLVHKHKAII
ncbi:hypothetical protein HYW44_04570 [Candidatus Daviesbacteria bacterium]|nr:hypothetical protein [Candidatus Daviesbacteria bacterium]